MGRKAILCREARGGAILPWRGIRRRKHGGAGRKLARPSAEEYKIGDVDLTVFGASRQRAPKSGTTPRDPRLIFRAETGRKMGVPANPRPAAPTRTTAISTYAPGFACVVGRPRPLPRLTPPLPELRGSSSLARFWGDFTQLYGDVPWGNYANGLRGRLRRSDKRVSGRGSNSPASPSQPSLCPITRQNDRRRHLRRPHRRD